jgi:hypothetical protein
MAQHCLTSNDDDRDADAAACASVWLQRPPLSPTTNERPLRSIGRDRKATQSKRLERFPTDTAKAFLEGAIKDLERLSGRAGMIGDDLALLAYLLDIALVEARRVQAEN